MVKYSNNKFSIITKTILVIFILSSIRALFTSGTFSWAGLLSTILLYGIIAKKDWLNEGTRVFGAFLMYYTVTQIRFLLNQPSDFIGGILISIQGLVFVYGVISLLFASKVIETVSSDNVAT